MVDSNKCNGRRDLLNCSGLRHDDDGAVTAQIRIRLGLGHKQQQVWTHVVLADVEADVEAIM